MPAYRSKLYPYKTVFEIIDCKMCCFLKIHWLILNWVVLKFQETVAFYEEVCVYETFV